ncbi:MAG TPA: sigma-54 dependent transcriptional regulator [Chitinophagaceae bacterium]|nr:sigma-54 dependent transcriptional regulator [Chitinophagaceae bacterium]HNF70865.1 sigma-54 dependent transcriptional regulator [Chitinophagaceae bacterium]
MLSDQELQSLKNRFGIIGNEPTLNYSLSVALQVAHTDLTVLIQGESGVGKEVFSQIIHSQSARKHNKFIAINCGAIPEGTIDSELFGHEKGSFTSATESRKGYFETVNGGTIFLDEIGEMPLGTQARLLRVLEAGEYIRVGSSKVEKTNVRVIAATNKDLLMLVQAGRFREDLYYRLSTVPIRVASLRERKTDIPILFRKFCIDFSEKYKMVPIQLNEDARELLTQYRWPGNIRELKNIAEQISVLSVHRQLNAQDLLQFLPRNDQTESMPVLSSSAGNSGQDFASERDILYKLFFDMKKDVNDLKKMFFEMIKNPALHNTYPADSHTERLPHYEQEMIPLKPNVSVVMPNTEHQKLDTVHEVEETLNIADHEKELIVRALKKHRSRRRDAASELGISERTLYRKIKEYDIED